MLDKAKADAARAIEAENAAEQKKNSSKARSAKTPLPVSWKQRIRKSMS